MTSSLPPETSQYERVESRYLYVPRAHIRALDPDNMLVVGIRGSGKSFWWHTLQSEEQRAVIATAFSSRGLQALARVDAGFGEKESDAYPSKDIIAQLLEKYQPRLIWRTVILSHIARERLGRLTTWGERVSWVSTHPEESSALLKAADTALAARGQKHLLLFDALDRTSDSWEGLRRMLQGLLQALLELRSSAAIRAKAFVRPDHLDDPAVAAFADASKIISTRVSLDWPRVELYGLLWQYLGNAPEGAEAFRTLSEQVAKGPWTLSPKDVWLMPEVLRTHEWLQHMLFNRIAGEFMGRDSRRGIPYTWLPSHLSDTYGKTSPRSFLAAIRAAAEDESHTDHPVALHWESIKRGVQKAAEIRVRELAEDYPWTKAAMKALQGLLIPATREDIFERWKQAGALDSISRLSSRKPRELDLGYLGLALEMQEIGIFQEMKDGRINVPDVYRVGFGLLRKGGVKPLK